MRRIDVHLDLTFHQRIRRDVYVWEREIPLTVDHIKTDIPDFMDFVSKFEMLVLSLQISS